MPDSDSSPGDLTDERYHPVASAEEIKESGNVVVDAGREIAVFHIDGEFHAFLNKCVHQGAPLCDGEIRGTLVEHIDDGLEYSTDETVVICPWHGWEFDIRTGKHLARPDKYKIPTFETVVKDGYVYIDLH